MRLLRTLAVLLAALVLLPAGLAGCGDDDDAEAIDTRLVSEEQQIRDTVRDILDACVDQDRDRLRSFLQDQDRDRLRDGSCQAIPGGAEVTVESEEIEIDGARAMVRLQLQVRDGDGGEYRLTDQWRFQHRETEGWGLSEPPASIDPDAGVPSTIRDQDRDRDRDGDQDRDQDRVRDPESHDE